MNIFNTYLSEFDQNKKNHKCTSQCERAATETDIGLGVCVHMYVTLQIVKSTKLFTCKNNMTNEYTK